MGICIPAPAPQCGPIYPDETLPPLGPTRLITQPHTRHYFNVQQETDARTALTRGLKEYIEQLSFTMLGRDLRFKEVFATWADPNNIANYPSAAVHSPARGKYDASKYNVQMPNAQEKIWRTLGVYPVSSCEYNLDLTLTTWASDIVEREVLVAMLEQALNPLDWRYGLLLELPFYFNQRATYELMDGTYIDSEAESLASVHKADFMIRGCVPVTRVETLPQAKIRANSTVTTSGQ